MTAKNPSDINKAAQELGKKGGEATKRNHTKTYYSDIRRGAWKKIKTKKELSSFVDHNPVKEEEIGEDWPYR
jgi:hypothetical protein